MIDGNTAVFCDRCLCLVDPADIDLNLGVCSDCCDEIDGEE